MFWRRILEIIFQNKLSFVNTMQPLPDCIWGKLSSYGYLFISVWSDIQSSFGSMSLIMSFCLFRY